MPIQQMMLGATPAPAATPYSVDFDGNDYLNIAQDSAFELGTTNFTAEAWYYADSSMNTGQYNTILALGWPFQLYWHDNSFKFWASSAGSSGNYFVDGNSFNTGANSAPQDAWNHVAVSRSGSTFRMFLNGALMSTATSSTALADPDHDPSIGRFAPNDNLYATGKVSNLRLIKGTALYTSYFTPSASALTNVTNTVLLCCNESTVTGATVKPPVAITAVGNPASSTSVPFDFNSYSVFFDGDDDRLTFAATSSFAFGTNDFTMECWAKRLEDNDAYSRLLHFGPYWNNNDAVGLNFDDSDHSGKITFGSYRNANQGDVPSNGRVLVSSSSVSSDVWYHVAVTRSSGTFRLFINGTLEDTDSSITTRDLEASSTNTLAIAGTVDRMVSEPFDGRISNVRIINGQALYTSTFTAPTEPLYVTSASADPQYVKLLCCNQKTTTEYSKTPGTITADGSPTVSSTDTPFA